MQFLVTGKTCHDESGKWLPSARALRTVKDMKKPFSVARVLAAAATLVLLTSGCMQAEVGVVVKEDGSADLKLRAVTSLDALASMASFNSSSDSSESSVPQTQYCRDIIEVASDGTEMQTTECSYDPCDELTDTTRCEVVAPLDSSIPSSTVATTTTAPLDKAALCAQMRKEQGSQTAPPEGIVVTEILDDKWCGWEITGTAKNTQEITATLTAMGRVLNADEEEEPPFDELAIAKDATGGWSLLLKNPLDCAPPGEDPATAGAEAMFGALMSDLKITYNIQLPGVPGANNATSVNGNTFTWSYSLAEMTAFCALPDRDFRALTTPGVVTATADASPTSSAPGDSDGGGSTLKILLSVAALAAAGAGGFVLKRRRDYSYTDTAVQTSVAPAQMAPVWDAAANAWAATGPDGIAYLYDQQTSQWVPRR